MPLLEGWGSVLHSIFHTSEQYPLDLQFNFETVTLIQELIAQSFYPNGHIFRKQDTHTRRNGLGLTSKPLVLCQLARFLYVWKS